MIPFKRFFNILSRCLTLLSIGLITLYRLTLSPLLAPRCRFAPSCSNYALEALRTHGLIKGFTLTFHRLKKCHPFGSSGFDPVPPLTPTEKK